MYLLNGDSKQTLDCSDRGFQYGDGLFETIEVRNGTPVFLDQHFQRLQRGCQRMLITPPDITLLKAEAFQLVNGADSAVLKLIVTRGSGGRGYRQPETMRPTRLFSLHPFPEYPDNYFSHGINVRFCHTALGLSPALAGIKHLNRLEQVMARSEWNTDDFQEGLMLDLNGKVIEGTMSNLFLIKDRVLMTPILDHCGVEGVLKGIIISLARANSIQVMEKNISKEDVYAADELFVSNSIIGIWPIKQLELQSYAIGAVTQRLHALLLALKQEEIHAC